MRFQLGPENGLDLGFLVGLESDLFGLVCREFLVVLEDVGVEDGGVCDANDHGLGCVDGDVEDRVHGVLGSA